MVERVAAVPEVAVASGLSVTRVLIDGRPDGIVGIDPAAFVQLADVDVRDGSLADLTGNTVAVARAWADDHHLTVGSTLPITFPRAGAVPMTVVAIYEKSNLIGTHLMPVDTLRANVTDPFDIAILVKAAGDRAPPAWR